MTTPHERVAEAIETVYEDRSFHDSWYEFDNAATAAIEALREGARQAVDWLDQDSREMLIDAILGPKS